MRFRLDVDRACDEEIVAHVHQPSRLTDEIERLVREDQGDTALTVYSEEHDVLLPLDYDKIECVSVVGGKTVVIDPSGQAFTTRLRLYELEERLPACFIRINKSALANRSRIARFEASFSGAVDAVFRSGYRDYVSRRCFAEIKRRLENP